MSLNWYWNEKCGEATFKSWKGGEYTVNLYVGNAFLIALYETEEQYTLSWYFVDYKHAKRVLEDSEAFKDMISIRLNKAKCRYWRELVTLFSEYTDGVKIETYTEGEKTWQEYEDCTTITDVRMREIAEAAISYLDDEGLLDEFLEDRSMELSPEEKEYFGVYDFDEDEEEW